MLTDIKAVLFDLDGTLIDSMWIWEAIDVEYLGKFGKKVPENFQKEFAGMSFSETASYFKKRFSIPDTEDEMKNCWNQMAEDKYRYDVKLKPGVLQFLEQCKKKNIKMGIGTSNSKELVWISLRQLGVEEYFDSVRTSCEVENGKPSPDIYQLVANDLGALPEECIVFEDVVHGILAGEAAGMRTCAVFDECCVNTEDEKKLVSQYYIKSFTELLEDGVK